MQAIPTSMSPTINKPSAMPSNWSSKQNDSSKMKTAKKYQISINWPSLEKKCSYRIRYTTHLTLKRTYELHFKVKVMELRHETRILRFSHAQLPHQPSTSSDLNSRRRRASTIRRLKTVNQKIVDEARMENTIRLQR
jgi:hypothetical protein